MSARFGKLALAVLSVAMLMLPTGLQAQDQAQDNVTIGPPQLRGFQLPGTTTTPAPQEEPPATPPATEAPPAGTAETPAPAPDPNAPAAPARAAEADDGARDPERVAPERTRPPVRAPLEPATAPASDVPLSAPEALDAAPVAPSEPSVAAEQAAEPGSALRWLYLFLAVVIAAAVALFVARKLRTAGVEEAEAYYAEPAPEEPQAGIARSPAPASVAEPAPEPAPPVASKPAGPVVSTLLRPAPAGPASARQPVPAQPAHPAPAPPAPAAPAPAVSAGSGVVGLAIRPWLNLEFIPDRAAATQTEAVVQYELLIKNVGNMVAGNIRVAARMFNAGADQDEQINAFFSQKIGTGPSVSKVLAIPPRKGARLRSAVSMSNEEVREISVQGRRLFIPLVAINVLYEWGNRRSGQTAASYLVGREPDAPEGKMGPFRLDLGPRVYRSVGQRPNKVALVV
ncbi:hypothetical protein [Sphingomonas sp.]|uniref:hypothetical protein n=1 Tax=Sphingomonas sp. TaxID=28214 RepID=UPI002FC7B23E